VPLCPHPNRSSIRTVRFNHDGKFLAIGTEDSTLLVWHTETGEQALALQLRDALQYLCWHPSKNVLAYVGDKPSTDKNNNRDGVIKWVEIRGALSR
jgi:WD40 repeat protein